MTDFKVLRGQAHMGTNDYTSTLTEGTDYTLENGMTKNNVFCYITGSRQQTYGNNDSDGTTSESRSLGCYIDDPESIMSEIVFRRSQTTGYELDIPWEIVQYIGPNYGANSIEVRQFDSTSIVDGTLSANGATIYSIDKSNDVAILICGMSNVSNSPQWDNCLAYTELIADGDYWKTKLTRGQSTGDMVISWAVIEFTGKNWRPVQRISFLSNEIGSSEWSTSDSTVVNTYTLSTALKDYTRAFTQHQCAFTTTTAGTLSQIADCVELGGNTSLNVYKRDNTYDAYKRNVVWIIENLQGGANKLVTQHKSGYDSSTTTGYAGTNYAVTEVDFDNASIFGMSTSSDGTSTTAFPRGWMGFRLTSEGIVRREEHDGGEENRYYFQVVEWPYIPEFNVNILEFSEAGHREVSIQCLVDYSNITELESYLEYASKVKYRNMPFSDDYIDDTTYTGVSSVISLRNPNIELGIQNPVHIAVSSYSSKVYSRVPYPLYLYTLNGFLFGED